jgi:putative toxin-antitoxin system antitoxin component (TIGR02293 family)
MATSQFAVATDVATLLGGKRALRRALAEPHDLREVVRDGLPFGALESFVKTMGIPMTEVTKVLGLAARTLARRKDQRTLAPAESDRLYRLARVASIAIQVLGSPEKATQWLERPNRALGGDTPLSFLDTDIGARQVEAVLGRIAHGVFS